MNKNTYTPKYRPPCQFTLPRNAGAWELVQRPAAVDHYDRRTDLPKSTHPYGVVAFERPLTSDEMRDFELKVVSV